MNSSAPAPVPSRVPPGVFAPIEAYAADAGPSDGSWTDETLTEIDAVYCISLQEQSFRTKGMVAELRGLGLAKRTIFYRPMRGVHPPTAIWASHRAVARDALARGYGRIAVFEDDVRLRISAKRLRKRLGRAISHLPKGAWGLYLGHFALQAYPIGADLLRARSGGTFAYVANPPLLRWLAATRPMDPAAPVWDLVGTSIDAAWANLPGMYALFPLAVRVVDMGDRRIDAEPPKGYAIGAWFTRLRYRDFVTFRCMRLFEILAMILSPYHALTLEYFRRRSGRERAREAARLRASGAFDPEWYTLAYSDVAAAQMEPLNHYLRAGVKEGRLPRAPEWFDYKWYLSNYGDVAASGMSPLDHYLRYGISEGRRPAPDGADAA
jgi:hypothetical protein